MPLERSVLNYEENDTGRFLTEDTIGAPNGTGVTAKEYGNGGTIHKTVLTLTNVSIATTDRTTAGAQGSLKIYDFPTGHLLLQGTLVNLTTAKGAGGLTTTAALVGSIGSATVGTGDATLTSTEADMVASMTGTLSASAGAFKNTATQSLVVLDGTGTAIDAYLNIAVPDAGSSADDTVTLNGTVTFLWSLGGL